MASCCRSQQQESRYLQLLGFQKHVAEKSSITIWFAVIEKAAPTDGWMKAVRWARVKRVFFTPLPTKNLCPAVSVLASLQLPERRL